MTGPRPPWWLAFVIVGQLVMYGVIAWAVAQAVAP